MIHALTGGFEPIASELALKPYESEHCPVCLFRKLFLRKDCACLLCDVWSNLGCPVEQTLW